MSFAAAVAVLADNGHMDIDGGWGVLIIAAMIVMMGGMGWMMFSMMRGHGSQPSAAEDPVEILKLRYARGELTTEEFHERLHRLEDAGA